MTEQLFNVWLEFVSLAKGATAVSVTYLIGSDPIR